MSLNMMSLIMMGRLPGTFGPPTLEVGNSDHDRIGIVRRLRGAWVVA
jgi:hypothetical protein